MKASCVKTLSFTTRTSICPSHPLISLTFVEVKPWIITYDITLPTAALMNGSREYYTYADVQHVMVLISYCSYRFAVFPQFPVSPCQLRPKIFGIRTLYCHLRSRPVSAFFGSHRCRFLYSCKFRKDFATSVWI